MGDWLAAPPTALDVIDMPTFAAVQLWFAAGYCYEAESFELIPDPIWHALCARLARSLPGYVCAYGHAPLIEIDALATGTCSYLAPARFPPFTRALAERLASQWGKGEAPYRTTLELMLD